MLKNNIKIAFRNLLRYKVFSFINVFGLGIGMACFILIMLWVQNELNFDRFYENSDEIYRVITQNQRPENQSVVALTPVPLGSSIVNDYPEILNYTRYDPLSKLLVSFGDKKFYEEKMTVADSTFFEIFSFSFIKGNPETALDDIHSVVITERIARKYFGAEDPMDKSLTISNRLEFKVTGVIDNIPGNSHIQFDLIFPWQGDIGSWQWNSTNTYLLLQKNIFLEDINAKIKEYRKKHAENRPDDIFLQPLENIHLYSLNIRYDFAVHGDIKHVFVFIISAILILVIACINFMNLSTARSNRRAKEVGVRKIVGANKMSLIRQFFGEAIFLSFLALLIAIILVEILLTPFNNLISGDLTLHSPNNIILFLGLFGLAFITGIISGSYPSIFLSSFKPVTILKGISKTGTRHSIFRKVLVITQFSLSIVLTICTIVILNQLEFINDKDLGFNKQNLIYGDITRDFSQKHDAIKSELLQNPNITNVTVSKDLPTYDQVSSYSNIVYDGKFTEGRFLICMHDVGFNFFETFEMEIHEGRSFSEKFRSDDTAAYVLNQAAVDYLEMESPLGKQFAVSGQDGKIIGIVKNFNFKSLHQAVEPLVFRIRPEGNRGFFFIRINSENMEATISSIKDIWQKHIPDLPFDYKFMDETIDRLYGSEQKMSKIFIYFALLAIIISCLGLFGLASFIAERRIKEIGIRKALGASVPGIVLLLTKEFARWIIIANFIAWPIGWYFMNSWLQNFVYRTEIYIGPFVVAGLIAFSIAILTVSSQTLRTAFSKPADSLKYE